MNKQEKEALLEEEIRPAHLMQEQRKRVAADINMALQYKDRFVSVSCPACGSELFRKLFDKYGFDYVGCLSCQTVYVNPRPTPEILEIFHRNSENYRYWNKCIFPASEDARRDKIFSPRAQRIVEICLRYGLRPNTIADIGAGFGTFCQELQKSSFFKDIIAVEPVPELAQTCRERGLTVIQSPVEELSLNSGPIDIITSFEVIEHLFSPKNFISICASLLSSDGLFILTCPNVKGFDLFILKELSDTFDIEHLNYLHPASLSKLLMDAGLEMLELYTPGKLDAELVRKKILSKEFDVSRYGFLKYILIEHWDELGSAFQEFLVENRLSSHMWVVARKL